MTPGFGPGEHRRVVDVIGHDPVLADEPTPATESRN
ncbi:MAG: hypothetical protein RIS41_300 [Actinomycetota bacterium]